MHLKLIAMDDDDHFYTLEEETKCDAASGKLVEASPPVATPVAADEYVDELQALNTALCFLCSINADSSEVERFLKRHPEALLLEGACLLPEDSAHYILEQHMRRCTCQGRCHQNRKLVFELVQRGFEWYQSKREHRAEAQGAKSSWSKHFQKLVASEHEIRKHRRQELLLRNKLIEAGMEFKSYKEELDRARSRQEDDSSKHSALALLACTRHKSSSSNDLQSQVSVLEYQVGVASVNLRSVERERSILLDRIRDGRRSQFAVLKKAFASCRRHDICRIVYTASAVAHKSSS